MRIVGLIPARSGSKRVPGKNVRRLAGDAGGRARALISLLRDPELAGRLGATGRWRARNEFDWSVVAGRVTDLYRDLVAGRS